MLSLYIFLPTTVVGRNEFGTECLWVFSSYNTMERFWIGIEDGGEAIPDPGGSCSQTSTDRGVFWSINCLFVLFFEKLFLLGLAHLLCFYF